MNANHEAAVSRILAATRDDSEAMPYGDIAAVYATNDQYGTGYLYLGDSQPRSILRPTQVYWHKDGVWYPDSQQPVICATTDPAIATFMALASQGGCPYRYRPNDVGGIEFTIHAQAVECFEAAIGSVAILEPDDFVEFNDGPPPTCPDQSLRRIPEMRATRPQIPLFAVQVTIYDFDALLDMQPASELIYQ